MSAYEYSIDTTDKKPEEFRWSKSNPLTFATDDPRKRLYCNGKHLKPKDWRASREQHRNQAFKWARCVQFILESLPSDSFKILKGCIKAPEMSPVEWSAIKRAFDQYRRRYCKSHGVEFEVVAKQHITLKKGAPDDMHFDFLAYTNSKLSDRKLNELVLSWIQAAGGKRSVSSVVIVDDRTPYNLERLANYCFKYAESQTDEFDSFMRSFPLPSTSFPESWVSGNFWHRSITTVEMTREWNGETQAKYVRQPPMEQVWREWIENVCGKGIPQFTTHEYREAQKLKKLINASQDELPIRGNISLASQNTGEVKENVVNHSLFTNSPSETSYSPLLSQNAAINFGSWQVRPISECNSIIGNRYGEFLVKQSELPAIIAGMIPKPLERTLMPPESKGQIEFFQWATDSRIDSAVNPTGDPWSIDEMSEDGMSVDDHDFVRQLKEVQDLGRTHDVSHKIIA